MNEIGKIPNEQRLVLMLKNGPMFVDMVAKMIVQHNLPFRIEVDGETGIGTLHSQLTPGEQYLSRFITNNKEMLYLKEESKKMASCPYEVLITGETGTGKELIARSMIGNRLGPIKSVNCAAIPSELIESELFGHVRGAFTDARGEKKGLLASAQEGVVFLDEVSKLSLSAQAKLLRSLQEKTLRRVGSTEEEEFNCKVVCASNKNLKHMVDDGSMLVDFYARVSTLELDLSPLRDRKDDVLPILQSLQGGVKFIEKYKDMIDGLDLSYNVRSLQRYVVRFSVLGHM